MASLGNDLTVIRKDQDLSFDDVQQITKLSPNVIKSIEDGSIFKKINRETTYVRNYVRNYAKAVGIEEEKILMALNQLEKGEYTGGLLNKNAEDQSQDKESDKTDDDTNEAETEVNDRLPEDAPSKTAASTNIPEPDASTNRSLSINWEELSRKTVPKNKSTFSSWIIILAVIILAIGTALLYNYFTESDNTTQPKDTPTEENKPAIPADTLQQALLPEQKSAPIGMNQPLPDTLTVEVIAASGKLAPVHIYTDIDMSRPYWVEKHDTLHVNFTDTIQVWAIGQFKQMELMFNGRIIANAHNQFYDTQTKRITITREAIKKLTGRNISTDETATN